MTEMDDGMLMAYLDGALGPYETLMVERELLESPALRAREAELRAMLGDLLLDFAYVDASAAASAAPFEEILHPATIAAPVESELPEKRAVSPISKGRTEGLQPMASARPRRWQSAVGWALAAGLLVAVGAAGGWWLIIGPRATATNIVATIIVDSAAPTDVRERAPTQRGGNGVGAASRTPELPRVLPPDTGQVGGSVDAPPIVPDSARLPASTTPVMPSRINVRLEGARVVSSSDRVGDDPGGVRTYEINGARVEVAFGSSTTATGEVLDAAELARLAASTGRTPGSVMPPRGTALRGGTVLTVASDSVCADGLLFRHSASGVLVELRGPSPCSTLAKLAAQLDVKAVP